MTQKDPYEILGVSRTASADEIKRKYRRLAKRYHPDRNPGDKSAEASFKEIQAAYEVLGDADRRAQFDQFGAGGPTPNFGAWGGGGQNPFQGVNVDFGGDLSSIFEQFFQRPSACPRSRRAPRRAKAKGADVELELRLGFMEAVNGSSREIMVPSDAGKSGRQRIEVRIPVGVSDGQRIRARGKGRAGPGGAGDLLIRCRIDPHPYFRREGNDVFLDVPLTITEAALGAKVEIPTLDGVSVVTVPPGTTGGARLRLRGKGVAPARGAPGDLYAIMRIATPKKLSKQARELLRQLDQEFDYQPRKSIGWPE